MADTVAPYPLHWPSGVPRSKTRAHPKFGEKTTDRALNGNDGLMSQLRNLGAGAVTVSSNIPRNRHGAALSITGSLQDPGVAVYFQRKGEPYQLACDRWFNVADNIWALAKHLEALRGMERWGVGTLEQAFAGYAALPPPGGGSTIVVSRSWWEILGVFPQAEMAVVEAAYKALAKSRHPDGGGSTEAFQELQAAWEQAKRERA